MKKVLSTFLAATMVLSMSAVSMAAGSLGDIYEYDEDGELASYSGDLTPGKTYYIYVGAYGKDEPKPSKLEIESEGYDFSNDKKIKLLSSDHLSVSVKKDDDGDHGYFATMKLKDISASSYYDSDILLTIDNPVVKYKDGSEKYIGGEIEGDHPISYPENDDIGEDPVYISLNDEVDSFYVGDTDAEVEIDSTGVKTELLISCDTSYDVRFGENYANANLDFYSFNNAKARKYMTFKVPMGSSKHIYERVDGGLKDVTNVVGKNFVVKTPALGKYVLSDIPLTTSAPSVTPSVTPSVPDTQVPGTNVPSGNIPFNPGTGANI